MSITPRVYDMEAQKLREPGFARQTSFYSDHSTFMPRQRNPLRRVTRNHFSRIRQDHLFFSLLPPVSKEAKMHRIKVAALAIGTVLLPGGILIPIIYTIRRAWRQRKASMTT